MERTLFYAEGGLAVADEDYSHLGNRDRIYKGSETRTGWFIGAGLEHAFDSNWSAKVEYNYIDFGSDDVSLTRTTGSGETRTAIFDVDQDMHVVKFGLNYRF
jgi:outer membrane immunogenic protein